MEEVERFACPRCGELAAIAGRMCPHCRGSLLVDLIAEPIPDPRRRYLASRALVCLGAPFGPIGRLQELLAAPRSVLAAGITRQAAVSALAILTQNGGKAVIAPREQPEIDSLVRPPEYESVLRPGRSSDRVVFVLPALLAGVLLFVLLRSHPRNGGSPIVAPPTVPASRPAAAALTWRELAARSLDSTATLTCPTTAGAGFFVAPDLLVTNDHVLCGGAITVQVTLKDGRRLPGEVQSRDDWLDLALVRVPGAAVPPLVLGDATRAAEGDVVLMIGNPVGMDFTVSRTIISHRSRNLFGITYLQFDGNVNPGNSGGPLLDSQGRAIGIVSMMVKNARGLGLALPVNYLYQTRSGELPLPVPAPDFAAWQSRLTLVHRQDEQELEAARAAFAKPGLAGAAVSPAGEAIAIVVARGIRPGATALSFRMLREGRVICNVSGIAERWDLWSHRREQPDQDSRYLRWLEKAGLADDIYVSTAILHTEGCPDSSGLMGTELILQDGDPGLDRAVLRPMREVS